MEIRCLAEKASPEKGYMPKKENEMEKVAIVIVASARCISNMLSKPLCVRIRGVIKLMKWKSVSASRIAASGRTVMTLGI